MNLPEFDGLLDAYLLQEASAEQCAQLREMLEAEPEARRRFVEVALLEARLHAASGSAIVVAPPHVPLPPTAMPFRRVLQRGAAGFRRLDLAAVAVVGVVVIAMFYVMRPSFVPPTVVVSGIAPIESEGREIEPEQASPPPRAEGAAQTAEGRIQSSDVNAKTFVLGGPSEGRTTFKVAVTNEGIREPAQVLLDGKQSTFEDAIQAQRKAVVTFLQVGNEEPWVWKVEVLSATR